MTTKHQLDLAKFKLYLLKSAILANEYNISDEDKGKLLKKCAPFVEKHLDTLPLLDFFSMPQGLSIDEKINLIEFMDDITKCQKLLLFPKPYSYMLRQYTAYLSGNILALPGLLFNEALVHNAYNKQNGLTSSPSIYTYVTSHIISYHNGSDIKILRKITNTDIGDIKEGVEALQNRLAHVKLPAYMSNAFYAARVGVSVVNSNAIIAGVWHFGLKGFRSTHHSQLFQMEFLSTLAAVTFITTGVGIIFSYKKMLDAEKELGGDTKLSADYAAHYVVKENPSYEVFNMVMPVATIYYGLSPISHPIFSLYPLYKSGDSIYEFYITSATTNIYLKTTAPIIINVGLAALELIAIRCCGVTPKQEDTVIERV